MFLGENLLVLLALAFGGALAVGNLMAVLTLEELLKIVIMKDLLSQGR